MERKFLESLGLDKDAVDKVMAENGKDIEKFKQQVTTVTGERDTLQGQLAEVAEKLKAFDGVDIGALKNEIATLHKNVADKENEFKQYKADNDFNSVLTGEIHAAKGKNAKAITALLNLDMLKASKNQKDDIAAALNTLKASDAYLFEEAKNEGGQTPAKITTGGTHDESGGGVPQNTNQTMNALIRGVK